VGVSAIGKGIRWLLVPLSAAAVVVAGIVGARWAVSIVDRRCPVESMVGGACVEPWHTTAVEASIYTAIVLAVLGLVILPSLIAPQLKRTVAVVAFLGAIAAAGAAYFMTAWAEMLLPLVVTVLSGGIGILWVWSRSRGVLNDRT
jgi:hypothetical protein